MEATKVIQIRCPNCGNLATTVTAHTKTDHALTCSNCGIFRYPLIKDKLYQTKNGFDVYVGDFENDKYWEYVPYPGGYIVEVRCPHCSEIADYFLSITSAVCATHGGFAFHFMEGIKYQKMGGILHLIGERWKTIMSLNELDRETIKRANAPWAL